MHNPNTRSQRFLLGVISITLMMVDGLGACRAWAADNEQVQPVYQTPSFWNGEWTDATDGYHYSHPDPGSSEGKSGNKPQDKPQHYWIPDPRQWADIDPQQLKDYQGYHYSPYAQLQVWQPLIYGPWKLEKGYYQIRLGQRTDGSSATRLQPTDEARIATGTTASSSLPASIDSSQRQSTRRHRATPPPYEVLLIYKLGKVRAVVPVTSVRPLTLEEQRAVKAAQKARGQRRWGATEGNPPVAQLMVIPGQPRAIELRDNRLAYRFEW